MVNRRRLDLENPVRERWLFRVKLARYLKDWVNYISWEARQGLNSLRIREYPIMKFCAGCARFKRTSEGWKSGRECLWEIDRMDRWEDYGSECTKKFLDRWCFWEDVEDVLAMRGLCSECIPRWRGLEVVFMREYGLYFWNWELVEVRSGTMGIERITLDA